MENNKKLNQEKQCDIHVVVKRLENMQKYYLDGDAYDNIGGFMSKEDDSEKGEWIELKELQTFINELKANVL
tara:strand:+ start:65 stop:280 length:216 start_codon:yes stop_codon:yes gene_type:complete